MVVTIEGLNGKSVEVEVQWHSNNTFVIKRLPLKR